MPAYIGVNGKAKAIAKVYKGNSEGKAEMIWAEKGVYLYGSEIDPLNLPACRHCGGSIGDYAIFLGGSSDSQYACDIYDSNLIHHSSEDLYSTIMNGGVYGLRAGSQSANLGDKYLVFTNGTIVDESTTHDHVAVCIDKDLISSITDGVFGPTTGDFQEVDLINSGVTGTLNHVFIAGGYRVSNDITISGISWLNQDLTFGKNTAVSLTYHTSDLGAATVNNIAIFAGGIGSTGGKYNSSSKINHQCIAVTDSCTKTSISAYPLEGVTQGITTDKHALFITYDSTSVISFDSNLTQQTITNGITTTDVGYYWYCAATYMPGYGTIFPHSDNTSVDFLDEDFVRCNVDDLPGFRNATYGAATGKYAIFAGGRDSSRTVMKSAIAYYAFE